MKTLKLIFSTLFILATTTAFSQIPIEYIDQQYIQLIGDNRTFDNAVSVSIDIGENVDFRISLEDGRNVEFDSMIEALNFFEKRGYEFVQMNTFNTQGGTMKTKNVYYYLLKRKQ